MRISSIHNASPALKSSYVGPGFWDQDFLAFTRLDRYPIVLEYIPRLGLNDAAMVFGGVVLALNIVTR